MMYEKEKNVDITLQKLTTEVTFSDRAYIEICQSGKKRSRRRSGLVLRPSGEAVLENLSLSFAGAQFVRCLCMNCIPLS